jgi:hypothetical protein
MIKILEKIEKLILKKIDEAKDEFNNYVDEI